MLEKMGECIFLRLGGSFGLINKYAKYPPPPTLPLMLWLYYSVKRCSPSLVHYKSLRIWLKTIHTSGSSTYVIWDIGTSSLSYSSVLVL